MPAVTPPVIKPNSFAGGEDLLSTGIKAASALNFTENIDVQSEYNKK